MDIAREYRHLVSQTKEMSVYVHNIEERPDACVYKFDGYLECAIILHEGRFYDVQDINIQEYDRYGHDLDGYRSFATLQELVDSQEKEVTP